jgi:tetrapyrrole methylase family protein/MazG family protein
LKLSLMAVYPDDHPVTLIHGAGTAQEHLETIPLYEVDRSQQIGHLTSMFVPPLPQPGSLQALAEAVAVLRSPEGCPWDREQTPQSLRGPFMEELAEVLEALDGEDPVSLQEEMGDLLLLIVMQTQMAREEEQFRLNDMIAGIYAKIRRRHPHVWGDLRVETTEEVLDTWEAIKADEKGEQGSDSILSDIPLALPALARAQKIQERVRRVGFDWPAIEGVVAKTREELVELQEASGAEGQSAELGDLLFAVVNWARWLGIDAETAMRQANTRFIRRFQYLERLASENDVDIELAGLDRLERFWQEAKSHLEQEKAG